MRISFIEPLFLHRDYGKRIRDRQFWVSILIWLIGYRSGPNICIKQGKCSILGWINIGHCVQITTAGVSTVESKSIVFTGKKEAGSWILEKVSALPDKGFLGGSGKSLISTGRRVFA